MATDATEMTTNLLNWPFTHREEQGSVAQVRWLNRDHLKYCVWIQEQGSVAQVSWLNRDHFKHRVWIQKQREGQAVERQLC